MTPASARRRHQAALDVHLYGRRIGQVFRDAHGEPSFTYDEAWRAIPDAVPLSLSMPLILPAYGKRETAPFLWGLLPENPKTLDDLARDFRVSPRNPVALLSHIGQDCAGAVQFLPATSTVQADGEGGVEWLSEEDIGQRLRALRQRAGTIGRKPGERGRFSLAGAQSKTAFHYRDGRWGVPSGRIPTTHIFKPPMPGLEGQVENEHFCLSLSRKLGFLASHSRVLTFADEQAIVVERYDRLADEATGIVQRIHQEDMCQASAIPPERKYQADGGPNIRRVETILRENSSDPMQDCHEFMRAIGFNFLIAGTDAHAKNFSVLIGRGEGRPGVRLAPLYDVNSALPYFEDLRDVELSLSVDGRKEFDAIMLRHWEREARDSRLDVDRVTRELRDMVSRLPDMARDTMIECQADGLDHAVLPILVDRLARRCGRLKRLYGFGD